MIDARPEGRPRQEPALWGGRILLLAVAYWACAMLGFQLAIPPGNVTAIFPSAGLALAAVILWGTRLWPGVWLGSFAANATHLLALHPDHAAGPALAASAAIACGAALQAWIGSGLVRPALGVTPTLDSIPGLLAVLGYGGVLSSMVNACIGTMTLALAGFLPPSQLPNAGITWWIGDAIAINVFTPLVLAWVCPQPLPGSWGQTWRNGVWSGLLIVAALTVYSPWSPLAVHRKPLAFILAPLFVLIGLASNLRVASLSVLLVAGIALYGTVHGSGPFAGSSLNEELLLLAAYVATNNLIVLVMAISAENRRHQEVALHESERLLQDVIKGASDVIFLKDRDSRYQLMNPAGARVLNHPVQAIIGKRDDEIMDPALAGELINQDQEVVASGQPMTLENVLMVDGRPRTFETTKVSHRDPSGQITGIIGVARDVTELREAAAEREQLAAVRRADELKSRILNMVSHELRTPLAIIEGYASLLAKSMLGPLNKRQAGAIGKILASTQRQTRLVNALLDLGLGLAGTFTISPHAMDLEAVARDVVESHQALAERKPVRLTLETPPSLPITLADGERIGQVLSNLIDNAIKNTPAKGRIRVRLQRQGDFLRVDVQDNGPGIPAEKIRQLFVPFSQLAESPVRGAGLGLAISKEFVTAHHGQIGCESQPGQGSSFWFTLPIVASPADSLAA